MVVGKICARAAIFVAAVALTPGLTGAQNPANSPNRLNVDPAPRYRADGPDADAYGRMQRYPSCRGLQYIDDRKCRVGAFGNYDALFPARRVAAAKTPVRLKRAATEPDTHYTFAGETRTLDQYLDFNHVTGFIVARGDTILIERYQYGQNDKTRFTTFSVAKSIVGILIGIAVDEGAIRSIDDLAEAYVPELAGTEYGRTSIRALLHMASGVAFREDYADKSSDIHTLAHLTLEQDPGGAIAALKRFNVRRAPPMREFSYSSADTLVLGLVLARATRRPVADYVQAKLWEPIGAEADASWNVDATGQEITFAYFNAVLRDYARLGLMLAHEGLWHGKRVLPQPWLLAASTVTPDSPFAARPTLDGGRLKYGRQFWLLPTPTRTYMMLGLRGQFVLIDPDLNLVLVQTALRDNFRQGELLTLWRTLAGRLAQANGK
ncbi:MAG: serine hydrolase domain-containing protein [Alphaproteobacteria bacterium]